MFGFSVLTVLILVILLIILVALTNGFSDAGSVAAMISAEIQPRR